MFLQINISMNINEKIEARGLEIWITFWIF